MATTTKTSPPEAKLQTKAKVDRAGRIVIPAEFRKALGVEPGKQLMMRVTEPGFMEVWTAEYWIRKAQETVRQYVPEDVSMVDELIAERRREAILEGLEFGEARRIRAALYRELHEKAGDE